MDSSSKYQKIAGAKSLKNSWLLDVVNAINNHVPSFDQLFDKETFYKFVLCVIVVAVLFVYMMVKVFKVRVREYPFNASDDREWRDWKPANPFHFPWQEVDGQPKKCHVKQE